MADGKMTEEPKLPVDKDWLVKVINRNCPSSTGVLNSYSVKVNAPEKGFMSVIYKVGLNWDVSANVGGLPGSVIIKIPTNERLGQLFEGTKAGETLGDMEKFAVAHNRECDFYNLFDNLKSTSPIPLPKCFYTQNMTRDESGMLILEDMSAVAANMGQREFLTDEHITTLIDHYVALQEFGFKHPEYKDIMGKPYDLWSDNEKQLEKMVEKATQIDPEYKYTAEELIEKWRRSMAPTDIPDTFFALGDSNPNNILWEKDPSNPEKTLPKVVAFIDFQLASAGNPLDDLCHAMLFKLGPEPRREAENAAVNEYFKKIGKVMKSCSVEIPSFMIESVRDKYRKTICALALRTFPMVVNFMSKKPPPKEFVKQSFEWFMSAIDDLDRPWK